MAQNTIFAVIEKELSWLAFNERVLQEAKDKRNPLIERVRFLGIYSNNLDEFYKVQLSKLKRSALIEKRNNRTYSAQKLLKKVNAQIYKMNSTFDNLYNELLLEMARNRIFLVNEKQLSITQEAWQKNFFHSHIKQHLSPIILNKETDLISLLKEDQTYLVVDIFHPNGSYYALVNVPNLQVSRFILLPSEKNKKNKSLILLDNILRFCMPDLFGSVFEFTEIHAYSIQITRDAEYDLIQELDISILEMMSSSLKQRLTADPVRLLYQRDMPQYLVQLLIKQLKIISSDVVIPSGRYHNLNDFMSFPFLGRKDLIEPKMQPLQNHTLLNASNYFNAIAKKDILLYYPYYLFDHILEILQQAALDPNVIQITINIYRVAKHSRIINSLINAATNGKKVIVIVELQARFDEAANIWWSKKLTNSGVKVIFSSPDIKIHAKLFLIERKENNKIVHYANIGTGNFNEKTSQIYTDLTLLTANPIITNEVKQVFKFIQNPFFPVKFSQLLVSPQNMRKRLNQLIQREIRFAKMNQKAEIQLKMNNLVDESLIKKLYEASQAGVKIRLLIRGMCALVPNIPNLSENISVISIVDQYLEHGRIYVFHNLGKKDVYISSADWMKRNMDHRVDVGVAIFDPDIKREILDTLEIQFSDNVKARIIDKDLSNRYIKNTKTPNRSQEEIYIYFKQFEEQEKNKYNEK